MRKNSVVVLIFCVAMSFVFASNDKLQDLLNKRDIAAIQDIIQKEPDNGEAYYAASIYYGVGDDALGTNKDEVKKDEYLKKSADLGFAEAELQYGFNLLNQGKNDIGLQYIVKSADQNYLNAITLLGDLFFAGYQDKTGKMVIEPEIDKAINYLVKAVEKDNQDARYTLGHIYLSPNFGKQNIAKALELFEDNIDYEYKVGHFATLVTLIDLYNEGAVVQANHAKLLDYYYLASLQGYVPALYEIGLLQRVGGKGEKIDIKKDPENAFINLEKVMREGHIDAMFRVSEMYFKGEGTQQSDMNAYIWMAIAEDLSGSKTNYSETILELIPKRQRQIAIDNKKHYRQFFSMPTTQTESSL